MIELKNDKNTMKLRSTLFWDVNKENLDAQRSKSLIVERVLTRGTIEEFIQMTRFYSIEEISQTVVKIGCMDRKTLNFISGYFNIPKENFLCYTKKQSNLSHWNS
jgi:hypothetical protein